MKIITGMHRSGTSMVANLVLAIEGQIDSETSFVPADQWNPNGYYENKDFVILNNIILLGKFAPSSMSLAFPPYRRPKFLKFLSSISNFNYIFVITFPKLIEYRARKRKHHLQELAQQHADKIVKDPRFSLIINPWNQAVKIEKILFIFRHPYEVAHSLRKRNFLPKFISYMLWKFHNDQFIKSSKNLDVVYINYSNFFDPQKCLQEFERLYKFLDLEFDREEAINLRDQIIFHELRHSNFDDQNLPKSVASIYNDLLTLHEAGN